MVFPKDEGVGDWKSGEIRIGQSPTLGIFFVEFLGQENTKRPFFPHAAVLLLPSRFGLKKTFLENQFYIHAAASKQKRL